MRASLFEAPIILYLDFDAIALPIHPILACM